MAVNLSPVGGVAAQFFTSTGAVLTGGKLYTYLAGTTTPAVTYTTSQGNIPWTNPVVLDAAGRVPGSGEIWLTDGIIYKFVLKDSNDVLIATYDNITGINSNSVAYTNQQEIITATAGQTVFPLSISYQPATNSLSVFVDGVNQYGPGAQYSYVETDSNTVTFNTGLHVGAEVKFTTTQQQGAGAVDASQVTYDPPFTGSVATNVEAKLAQYVSVKDFGAVGDGVTDDTAAIQAALLYIQNSRVAGTAGPGNAGGTLFVPAGKYKLTASIDIGLGVTLVGEGVYASLLIFDGSISGAGSYCVSVGPSTVPGYTFGYTFGTRLTNIGITCGGTENYGILVPGMHQHSIIDNVNLRFVGDIGIQLNGAGGPAYNVIKQVSIGSSNSTTATATGIVCNANAANSYLEAISIEAEYGQVFAIGVDVIATNVNFNTIHFAYCTKGIRLKAYAQGLYASDVSSYIRFAHDDASGPCTDLIYVDSGYAGGFVIEGTYSYAVPIGTLGCKILNNQITGQSIPSSRTVNFYRYPEWVNVYTEPQTADPLYTSFTPAITADVDNTGSPLTQPAVVIKQTGTTYGNFIPGYGGGFIITTIDSFRFWPTGCQYVADQNALIATTAGVDLGSGTYRWDTLYATNGTINTSDANEKQQIESLSDAERAVALEIKSKVKKFKFNSAVAEKGDAARIHVGVIAQDVEAAFKTHGLNPDDYGLFCRDTWYEVDGKKFDETTGKDYTAASPNAISVTRLGVRYDELLAFIISAF